MSWNWFWELFEDPPPGGAVDDGCWFSAGVPPVDGVVEVLLDDAVVVAVGAVPAVALLLLLVWEVCVLVLFCADSGGILKNEKKKQLINKFYQFGL